jgi:aconitase A
MPPPTATWNQYTPEWNQIDVTDKPVFDWHPDSTYIREPSLPCRRHALARGSPERASSALFGDFITTDHISPAGNISKDSPAARYLVEHGIEPRNFNSYGSRRGNHEVMMRGTFGNIRLRNRMASREGGWTRLHSLRRGTQHFRCRHGLSQKDAIPVVVIAGKLYGAGSSRDWAAKGPMLLGVRAVIAESFERIHRSNLVEMGVMPFEFTDGKTAESIGLDGTETISIRGTGPLVPRGVHAAVATPARRIVRSGSPSATASTPPLRSTTTKSAASSPTSCANCSPSRAWSVVTAPGGRGGIRLKPCPRGAGLFKGRPAPAQLAAE